MKLPAQNGQAHAPEPLREGFRAVQAGGLDRNHTALRLWRKAKRKGIWNPEDLDFSQDTRDWQSLSEAHREVLIQLGSQFLGGEEAVTLDLIPLLRAVVMDGYVEDEIFLTAFLFEEAKHVEFFDRFLNEVTLGERPDGHQYFGDSYRRLFYDELPRAMQRLYTEPTPEHQAEASVVYNMIVEGVVAETGYFSFHRLLQSSGILPGTMQGIQLVQQDEARHLRFAVYFLERLVAEHGDHVYEAIQRKMASLLPLADGITREGYARLARKYGRGDPAITELRRAGALGYTNRQFQRRMACIERARGRALDDILYGASIDPDTRRRLEWSCLGKAESKRS